MKIDMETGLLLPSGSGGTPGGGGNSEFYKCSSVDSETTWSGKKWVLTDGIYGLAETVTSNLPYGTGFTPAVGISYNANATIRVDKMFEGSAVKAVFYASLSGKGNAETGQILTPVGTVVYEEVGGKKAFSMQERGALEFDTTGLPDGNAPRSIAFWGHMSGGDGSKCILSYGSPFTTDYGGNCINDQGLSVEQDQTTYDISFHYNNDSSFRWSWDNGVAHNQWAHYAFTFNGSALKYYKNGTLIDNRSVELNTALGPGRIGCRPWGDPVKNAQFCGGAIRELYIADYAFDEDQIATLSDPANFV